MLDTVNNLQQIFHRYVFFGAFLGCTQVRSTLHTSYIYKVSRQCVCDGALLNWWHISIFLQLDSSQNISFCNLM